MTLVKPPPVVSGETVLTQWGVDMVDLTKSKMRFERNSNTAWQVDNIPGWSGNALVELTQVPANNPNIIAAEVQVMIRHSDGTNCTVSIKHYNADPAAAIPANIKYNTGTNIGGMTGGVRVNVGGVNNRQIVWSGGGTGHWLRVLGWWVADEAPPYPIEGDPIIAGWGDALTERVGERWEFVPAGYTSLGTLDGNTGKVRVAIPSIPANDPDIVAVSCSLRMTDAAGAANLTMSLYDGDEAGLLAGTVYTSGVEGRGGLAGPLIVLVGGAANNEIVWTSSEAGANVDCTIWVLGYWKRQKVDSPNLPPQPAPSTVISSAWGNALADLAGTKLRFVPCAQATVLNAVDGVASPGAVVELPDPFPANDPTVVAASISVMIRDSNGAQNLIVYALHFDGITAGFAYSDGVMDRGGTCGPFYVKVGGTNGRQVKWHSSTDSPDLIDVWMYLHGWYVRETA